MPRLSRPLTDVAAHRRSMRGGRGGARVAACAAALPTMRERCVDMADAVAPLAALYTVAPARTARAAAWPPASQEATERGGVTPDVPREILVRRVIEQLRALDLAPLPDDRDLAAMALEARRDGRRPLHLVALPLISPQWTWYEESLGDTAAPWPELMLHAAASRTLDTYYATRDLAQDDARADEGTVRAVDALNRRGWESSVKNGGHYFWSDDDRVDGGMPCPGDIWRAVAEDVAGSFAREGLAGVPGYATYIGGHTDNIYFDVLAEQWEEHLTEEFSRSPGVAARARGLWRAARTAIDGYRATRDALDDPRSWPAFLRAYRATLDWCFGPGMRAEL